jgi:hypothetical protein
MDGACAEFYFPLPPRDGWLPDDLRARNRASLRQLYQLVGRTAEDLMFPSWIKRRTEEGTVAKCLRVQESGGLPVFDESARMRFAIAGGLDISSTGRKGTALWILCRDQLGIVRPVEVDAGAWTISDMIARIDSIWSRGIHFSTFNVENNGIQQLIVDALKRSPRAWARRIEPFTTGANKSNTQHGLPQLDVEFDQGTVVWPVAEAERRDYAHAKVWREFEDQMGNMHNLLDRKMTPDKIMAYWFARKALERVSTGQASASRAAVHIRANGVSSLRY